MKYENADRKSLSAFFCPVLCRNIAVQRAVSISFVGVGLDPP